MPKAEEKGISFVDSLVVNGELKKAKRDYAGPGLKKTGAPAAGVIPGQTGAPDGVLIRGSERCVRFTGFYFSRYVTIIPASTWISPGMTAPAESSTAISFMAERYWFVRALSV